MLKLSRLVKLEKKPSVFYLEVDGVWVKFTSYQLIHQRFFWRTLFKKTGMVWHSVSDDQWENILRGLLENITIVDEVPDERS